MRRAALWAVLAVLAFGTPAPSPAAADPAGAAECVITVAEAYGWPTQAVADLTCVGLGASGNWSLDGEGYLSVSCLQESGDLEMVGSSPFGSALAILTINRVGHSVVWTLVAVSGDYNISLLGYGQWASNPLCPLDPPAQGSSAGFGTMMVEA